MTREATQAVLIGTSAGWSSILAVAWVLRMDSIRVSALVFTPAPWAYLVWTGALLWLWAVTQPLLLGLLLVATRAPVGDR